MKRLSHCVLAGVLWFVVLWDVRAQTTNSWNVTGSGLWQTPGNWTDGIPTNTHAAMLITNATTKTITINSATPTANLTISNLFISGPASSTNTLQLTNAPASVLTVLNSLVVSNNGLLRITNAVVNLNTGAFAFTVDGAVLVQNGGILTNGSGSAFADVNIGWSSSGSLTLESGSSMILSQVIVGAIAGARGTLTMQGGALSFDQFLIANNTRTTGTVWMTGGSILATNGQVEVGSGGAGQMIMSNGFTRVRTLYIPGSIGDGTLTIAGGTNTVANGNPVSGNLTLGRIAGGTGTVWLVGADAQLVATNIGFGTTIGSLGAGQMIVSNGEVLVGNTVLGSNFAEGGTLTVAGGSFRCVGNMSMGNDTAVPTIWIKSGEFTITNGSPSGVLTLADDSFAQMIVSGGTARVRSLVVSSSITRGGTLTLQGGNLIADSMSIAGPSATGMVWVAGTQQLSSFSITVGSGGTRGSGQMVISNGTVLVGNLRVGLGTDSSGTLTMLGGSVTVTSAFNVASGIFPGSNALGTAWVKGGVVTVTNADAVTGVGTTGDGNLIISNGIFLANAVSMGVFTNSHGIFTVAGGTNAITGPLTVGGAGAGTVTVSGGQLVVTNTPASVGAGSGFIVDGSVTLTNGSSIIVSSVNTVIGNVGSGGITMYGGTMSAGNLIVGENAGARGTLIMTGGVLSAVLTVGDLAGAAGTVWVLGGQVTMNPITRIGAIGSGQLILSNGTMVAGDTRVGRFGGSSGTLTIAGGISQFTSQLIFGDSSSVATGTLWMTGGSLTNALAVIGSNGVGRATISNGTYIAANIIVAANPGARGTFSVAGGTAAVATNLTVGNFACTATGVVDVVGGNLFVTNATGTAVLDIRNGTLTLSSGTLTIDKLVVTNSCGHFVKTGGTLILNTPAILGAGLDADGDGLPNDWEQANGLDPLDPNGANGPNGDPDGDGQSNLAEYLAGTVPTVDIKSIVRTNNDIRVTWQAAASKTNALQRSPGSNGSFSNNFADIFVVTNNVGSVTNYLDTGAATNVPTRYYRIRLVP